jgi:hypothetical protein
MDIEISFLKRRGATSTGDVATAAPATANTETSLKMGQFKWISAEMLDFTG